MIEAERLVIWSAAGTALCIFLMVQNLIPSWIASSIFHFVMYATGSIVWGNIVGLMVGIALNKQMRDIAVAFYRMWSAKSRIPKAATMEIPKLQKFKLRPPPTTAANGEEINFKDE